MTKADDLGTRITLTWKNKKNVLTLPKFFQPTSNDYEFLSVPSFCWPLYYLIRPIRILVRKILPLKEAPLLWPFLGTPMSLIGPLMDYAKIGPNNLLVDIGCGDGRFLISATKSRNCKSIGIELSKPLADEAIENVKKNSLQSKIRIICADATSCIPHETDIVFLFLPMRSVAGLLEQLEKTIQKSFRVIIHEQEQLDPKLTPTKSKAIFSESAITVAHIWEFEKTAEQ